MKFFSSPDRFMDEEVARNEDEAGKIINPAPGNSGAEARPTSKTGDTTKGAGAGEGYRPVYTDKNRSKDQEKNKINPNHLPNNA